MSGARGSARGGQRGSARGAASGSEGAVHWIFVLAFAVKEYSPDGKVVKLPMVTSEAGPSAIDVRGLYAASGVFTFDPGFTSTCSCSSKITLVARVQSHTSKLPAGDRVESPEG